MNREYHKWHSPALGRDMEILVFGHGGTPVLVFPTSMGRFYDYENRGMIAAVGDKYENGQLQAFCVDSVDAESSPGADGPTTAAVVRIVSSANHVRVLTSASA